MNETPLVSIITPSYNHGKYIRDTIESVVNQSYKNIEYFVVDDGSTDNSAEVIAGLKEKYSLTCEIHFEVQQNKGLAFTMNKLIAKCKGKYIALIESDDVWTLDKIERQVTFLEENKNISVCGGHAICINEQGEILPFNQQALIKHRIYNFEDIMSFNYQIFPLTVMMRREVYNRVVPFDESLLYIDAYTWLKISSEGHEIVILSDLFGYYRMHESNVHWNSFKMYQTLVKTLDKFKSHPLYSKATQSAMYYIFPYLAVNDKKEAILILPKAFRLKWRIVKGLIILIVPYPIFKFFTRTRYK